MRPVRAPKGTIDSVLLIRLTAPMRKGIERAAKAAGLTLVEWIRQAIAARLPETKL